MPHFKVHELLSAAELEQLEAFSREPGRTVDEVWEWLQARGYTMSRSSAGRWFAEFRQREAVERMRSGGSLAKAFMEAAKDSGGVAVSDAAVLQVAQLVFEAAADAQGSGKVSTEDLANMALALQRVTTSKAKIEDTRSEMEKRQRAAVEAGEKAMAAGKGPQDVVSTIKKALGITGKPE
jgi:hypothetical protein